jgi:uncharacterized protein DUF6916
MTDITLNNLHNGPEVISRRTFIKGVGIALAGSALLAVGGRGLLRALWVRQVLPGDLKRSLLSRHLGETFHVRLDSSNLVGLQLTQVKDLGAHANVNTGVDTEHSFSVLFRGPADRPLGQATYQFGHAQIGSFPLFIVPMAPADGARYYEAVFNRLSG